MLNLTKLLTVFVVIGIVSGCGTKQKETKPESPTEVPASVYENRSVKDVLTAVAYHQVHELADGEYRHGTWEEVEASKPPEGMAWNYPRGVVLYGLLYANEHILKDPKILAYVQQHNEIAGRQYEYLDWQIKTFGKYTNTAGMDQLIKLCMLDHCGSITSQMLESILRHSVRTTPQMHVILNRVSDYIANRQSRLNGTFWRPESMGGTLWVDDLYMGCPFLVRWYQYTGDQKFLDDAVHQIISFANYNQDEDGLWYHGYFFGRNERSLYKWGRANGWAIVATVEVLSAMPENHPQRQQVLAILMKHIDGLIAVQAESGLWRQVLNHPELWEETSCTAMFAYGIARAVNRGWVDRDKLQYAEKAFQGLNTRVTKDGGLIGTCQGTGIGMEVDFYKNRQRPFDDDHGPGAVLLALTEIMLAQGAEM
jgi:unsaturated rhamnogalacturonyl hydrolase